MSFYSYHKGISEHTKAQIFFKYVLILRKKVMLIS